MKFNISFNSKKIVDINSFRESGQTLIETLIVYSCLFFCAFFVIEVTRFLAFKNCLQAATSYIVHQISYSQIDLLQKNKIPSQYGIYENIDKKFEDSITSALEKYLNSISTTFFSYDNNEKNKSQNGVLFLTHHDVRVYLKFVNDSKNLPAGVYIESQSCLPVLFSSFFRHFKDKSNLGNPIHSDSKNCLGHFNSSPQIPLYWLRARVAAYSPWPASTQIFNAGLAQPAQFDFLEQENRDDVLNALDSQNLSKFFTLKN